MEEYKNGRSTYLRFAEVFLQLFVEFLESKMLEQNMKMIKFRRLIKSHPDFFCGLYIKT